MIRFRKAPVATSVQDLGRLGHRSIGHARSGAMDPASLVLACRCAGATDGSAAVELGPGPCSFEVVSAGTIAFGGAVRDGAPWWKPLRVRPGDGFDISAPRDGTWSYVAIAGGVDAAETLGSRSTCVREGIGAWIVPGDVITAAGAALEPREVEAPAMRGPIRVYGSLPGEWSVGRRADRMGYTLDGATLAAGTPNEWSEPMLPGFVQAPPGGIPIVLMAEGPTVGGYRVAAVIHSDDLRLVAQARQGESLTFVSA